MDTKANRMQHSSPEEAYAGPIQMQIPNPRSDNHQPYPKRFKRTANLSEDITLTSVKGLIIEQQRVSGPRSLKRTQETRRIEDDDLRAACNETTWLRGRIESILRHHGMMILKDITLIYGSSYLAEDRELIPVLEIHVNKTEVDHPWVQAADEIMQLLEEKGLKINIHFVNAKIFDTPRETRCQPRTLKMKWEDQVQDVVLQTLRPNTELLFVGLLTRGRPTGLPEDDFFPTIVVAVKESTQTNWAEVRAMILNAISQYEGSEDIAVEIVRDRPWGLGYTRD